MGFWGIAKIAATKIPWGRVLENVPAVVELVGRRFRSQGTPESRPAPEPARLDHEERLRLLQEENLKLGKALIQMTQHQQEIAKSLEVVAARQKMLTIATALTFLLAVSALVLVL